MVNGISEKGLSVNHKVKIVNFPGGTSEKILEKLDVIITEKPDDLVVHVGTSDIANNVNLLTKVKTIFNKDSKELPSKPRNIQKTRTDTNARLKIFVYKKELVLLITVVLRNFI